MSRKGDVHRPDGHIAGGAEAGDFGPDCSVSEDADGAPGESRPMPPLPRVRLLLPKESPCVIRKHQHAHQGVLAHRDRVHAARVRHGHVAAPKTGLMEMVSARTEQLDPLELRRRIRRREVAGISQDDFGVARAVAATAPPRPLRASTRTRGSRECTTRSPTYLTSRVGLSARIRASCASVR